MKKIVILLIFVIISIISNSSIILARENLQRLIKVKGMRMTLGELRQMEKRIAQNAQKLGYQDHRYNIDMMFKTMVNGKPILTPKKYVENLKKDDKFFANMVKIKEKNGSLEAENYALRNEVERLRKRNRELESAANTNATSAPASANSQPVAESAAPNAENTPSANVSPSPEESRTAVESASISTDFTSRPMDNGTKFLIFIIGLALLFCITMLIGGLFNKKP